FDAARHSANHARRLRPDAPDAAVLLGAISLAEDEPLESLRWYETAIELDPDYFEPYVAASQISLFDLGDPAKALRFCEDGLDLEHEGPLDLLELELLAAEAELELQRPEAVTSRLERVGRYPVVRYLVRAPDESEDDTWLLSESAELQPLEPTGIDALDRDEDGAALDEDERRAVFGRLVHLVQRVCRLWLDLFREQVALPMLRSLVRHAPQHADSWYLLSEAEHLAGRPRIACHAALRVYRLDAHFKAPDWLPSPAQVHRKVVEILGECQDSALRELSQRRVALIVLIHEVPGLELILEGIDPRTPVLALASSSPVTGEASPATPTTPPELTGLAIYRRSLMRVTRSPQQFEAELRHAVLEELAAFFELDNPRRESLGLAPLPTEASKPAAPAEEEPPPRRRRRK
ncbi:MAG: metallopeptidase family protein, partial [Nannocystaceae bacterium]